MFRFDPEEEPPPRSAREQQPSGSCLAEPAEDLTAPAQVQDAPGLALTPAAPACEGTRQSLCLHPRCPTAVPASLPHVKDRQRVTPRGKKGRKKKRIASEALPVGSLCWPGGCAGREPGWHTADLLSPQPSALRAEPGQLCMADATEGRPPAPSSPGHSAFWSRWSSVQSGRTTCAARRGPRPLPSPQPWASSAPDDRCAQLFTCSLSRCPVHEILLGMNSVLHAGPEQGNTSLGSHQRGVTVGPFLLLEPPQGLEN